MKIQQLSLHSTCSRRLGRPRGNAGKAAIMVAVVRDLVHAVCSSSCHSIGTRRTLHKTLGRLRAVVQILIYAWAIAV